MQIKTIEWRKGKIRIIDQTKLPSELKYLDIDNISQLWQAIKQLKVRGAPALGAAAAFGVYLGIRNSQARNFEFFHRELKRVSAYLSGSRPTAKNLFWAIERVKQAALKFKSEPIDKIKQVIFQEAREILEQDRRVCRAIGSFGSRLLKNNTSVLTICNAGALATVDYGTALALIYRAQEQGKKIKVYFCETRPLLQGSRLTGWELKRKKIDSSLICDNTAAQLMSTGKLSYVIAGADRIAANGDSANKIGTLGLAILAKHFNLPFFIAAPQSSFDLAIESGASIPIEQRNPDEVRRLLFKKKVAPPGVKVYNPAFDVTPYKLISAFITEKGIIRPPFFKNISKAFRC